MKMSKTIFTYETLVHATAGMTGSLLAMACFYPLDMVKFRVQLSDKELLDKSAFEAIIYLIQNEGIGSLYRGIKPVLQTLGVSSFVYFYTFHGFKSLIPKDLVNSRNLLALSILAGVVNVLTTNPLWVVNNRLKAKEEVPYTGLLTGLAYIARTEGLASLWVGVGPSLLLVSNPAIHFTLYESLKKRINLKSATAFFILGALSKTIATIVTYPLQLIQTRLRHVSNRNVRTADLILSILKESGSLGLYQGMESKLLQTVLATALMYVTYEKIAQLVFRLLLGSKKRAAV